MCRKTYFESKVSIFEASCIYRYNRCTCNTVVFCQFKRFMCDKTLCSQRQMNNHNLKIQQNNHDPHFSRNHVTLHMETHICSIQMRASVNSIVPMQPVNSVKAQYNQVWPQKHNSESSVLLVFRNRQRSKPDRPGRKGNLIQLGIRQ